VSDAAGRSRLTVIPLSRDRAGVFIDAHHRHLSRPIGHLFALGVVDELGELRGAAMIGRPIARRLDDGLTAEVNRVATDGCPNANSALYAAAWRACAAMGYRRLITYTQAGESGSSLLGAGWVRVRELPARGSWAIDSVLRRAARDPIAAGGVARTLWERADARSI
jgi:hypothetical protein